MMQINELIVYSIALIALTVGSYTDFKKREVADWVNYGLIGTGLSLAVIFSLFYQDYKFILNSLAGFGIFFVIAWIMFYTGQWGGGDSKMLMGLGALLGLEVSFTMNFFDNFLVSFLVNMLLAGAIYGLLFSFYLAFRNRKKFIKEYKKIAKNKIIEQIRKYLIILFILVLALVYFVNDFFTRFFLTSLLVLSVLSFYMWMFVKVVEKSCMYKYVKPAELTEGDWIAKEIKVNGKYIAGPKDLGIEMKQIKKLINFYKKKKVGKILIKEGIPFVPSFFISFVITIFHGNVLMLLF